MTGAHEFDSTAELRWYSAWFGEEYLQLYPHRDNEEARTAVELVLRYAPLPPEPRVLDLACGAGRHLREFGDQGVRAIGLDLSPFLVQRARDTGFSVIRADMRALPISSASFDLVANFFTSFGYFADPQDDRAVLAEVGRVLRTGGYFAFDFLNSDHVRSALPSRDERIIQGRSVRQHRTLVDGGRTVEKRIEILGPTDPIPHIYYERVRLYSPDELAELLAREGLQVINRFGSYSGDPLTSHASRAILLGRAV